MANTQRIGLFGGTFDPIHLGHTQLAERIMSKFALNDIYFIPIYIHPFNKRSGVTPASDRLEMVHLAIKNIPEFHVCDYEIKKEGISYTVDTISYFRNKFPLAEIFYLIGKDNVQEFSKWKDPEVILKNAKIIVYDRETKDHTNDKKPDLRFIYFSSPLINISSSMIREKIKLDIPCQRWLHPDVNEYILEKKIYLS